ncbi:hypothetical protein WMY93_011746 [Mugilogobius chulae]|uniref:Centromere protein S n=1 Tax=Mugilogobius chulae TaxID=88201 RepID=A0AAW0P3R0_9GOBI
MSLDEDEVQQFSRQTIAAVAETTYSQCEIFARDLEAFARHAKRTTVSADDVKLVARRSTALSTYIQNKSEELNQEKKNTGRGKVKTLRRAETKDFRHKQPCKTLRLGPTCK